jgi:PKHD-type hydroxylase
VFYSFSSDGLAGARPDHAEPAAWQNDHVCDVRILPNWLGKAECSMLMALSDSQVWHRGRLRDAARNARNSDCAWLEWADSTRWLYEKLAASFINANHAYRFDLQGMNEPPQLLRYGRDGHLDWHQDVGLRGASVRKLALVALVARSPDCVGGALQFCGEESREISMEPGTALIFPPFLVHRVTPLMQGNRMSLAAWAVGPSFR